MRDRLTKLQRGALGLGIWAVTLAGGPVSTSAEGIPAETRTRDILDLCAAAESSLALPANSGVRFDDAGRAALVAGAAQVRDAYRLWKSVDWSGDLDRAGARLGASLRVAETRLARLVRVPNPGAVPHARASVQTALTKVHRAVVLLQEVVPPVPPPPPPPLANANPAPAAPVPAPAAAGFEWTNLSPSSDSLVVYVSSSQTDDSGDGLTPATAKKTLAAGYGLLRNNYPDWLLLKKGDSWTEDIVNTPWGKSGRSAAEPIVISSYGTGARPRVVNAACFSDNTSNVSITDIAFDVASVNDAQPWRVLAFGQGSNFLIEGCYFARGGVNMQRVSNIKFRGNVVVDAWSTAGAIGAYFDRTDNLLVEGCVFDHNGWRDPNIPRSWFTHNIYIQIDCTNVTVRNNIFARGSGEGCMQRPGGLNENNLYLQSPIAINWGYNGWTFDQSHAPGTIRNNVVLDACDLTSGVPRGIGFSIINAGDVEIAGNIIAHQVNATWGMGITPGGELQNLKMHDNLIYDWHGKGTYDGATVGIDLQGYWRGSAGTSEFKNNTINLTRGLLVNVGGNSPSVMTYSANTYYNAAAGGHFRYWGADKSDALWAETSGETSPVFSQGNYVDPDRDIAKYMTSLGSTATLEAFLAEARLQSKSNWRNAFTANAVNEYVRAGFATKTE